MIIGGKRMNKREIEEQVEDLMDEMCKIWYEYGAHFLKKKFSPMINRAYNKGCNDAWECARKLFVDENNKMRYSVEELLQIFNRASGEAILLHYTASEAIGRFKEYEQIREQINKEAKKGHWIITIDEDGSKYIMCSNCKCGSDKLTNFCPVCGSRNELIQEDTKNVSECDNLF